MTTPSVGPSQAPPPLQAKPAPATAPVAAPSSASDGDTRARAIQLLEGVRAVRGHKASKPDGDGPAAAVLVYNQVLAIDNEAVGRLAGPGLSDDTRGLLNLVRWAARGKLVADDRIDLIKNGDLSWNAMRQAVALAPKDVVVARAYAQSLIGMAQLGWLKRKIVTHHADVDLGKEARVADLNLQAFPADPACVLVRQDLAKIHHDPVLMERTALDLKLLTATNAKGLAAARGGLESNQQAASAAVDPGGTTSR